MRIQITDAKEYDREGFVIEQLGYWNTPELCWAIPAWEERGYPDFAETFPTREAAERAIRDNGF